jgi:transposase
MIVAALRQRGGRPGGARGDRRLHPQAHRRRLIEAEVTVFLVNPGRIKAFRDAEGLRAKTDRLDASLIARFAHAMAHELRPLADVEQAVLKVLSTRRRQQLTE